MPINIINDMQGVEYGNPGGDWFDMALEEFEGRDLVRLSEVIARAHELRNRDEAEYETQANGD